MRNSISQSYSEYQAEQLMSILLRKKGNFCTGYSPVCVALSSIKLPFSQPWQGLSWNAQKEKSWSKLHLVYPGGNPPGQGCKHICTGLKGLTKGRQWPLFPLKFNKPQFSISKLYAGAQHSFTWSFMIFAVLETSILSALMDLWQGKITSKRKKAARIVEHE